MSAWQHRIAENEAASATHVKVIFFDLGGVLVDVHLDRFLTGLAARLRCSEETVRLRLEELKPLFLAFDRGELESGEFYRHCTDHLGLDVDFAGFSALYTGIFDLKSDTLALAMALSHHFRLSIISNTDPMHYGFIMDRYPLLRQFENPVTSFAARALKPEPEIFHYALAAMGVSPSETLLIDDLPQNVAGAVAAGMQAIWFEDTASLQRQLQQQFPWMVHAGSLSPPLPGLRIGE